MAIPWQYSIGCWRRAQRLVQAQHSAQQREQAQQRDGRGSHPGPRGRPAAVHREARLGGGTEGFSVVSALRQVPTTGGKVVVSLRKEVPPGFWDRRGAQKGAVGDLFWMISMAFTLYLHVFSCIFLQEEVLKRFCR